MTLELKMTLEEKDWIEEKFLGLAGIFNEKFKNIEDKLETIHSETKRTNGRVTKLEEYKNECVEIIATRVHKSDIDEIKKSLEDVNFIMRHPKIFVVGFAILVILMIGNIIEKNPLKSFEKVKTEYVSPITKPAVDGTKTYIDTLNIK